MMNARAIMARIERKGSLPKEVSTSRGTKTCVAPAMSAPRPEHLEHQRDLVAKDHDALLPSIPPPIGSVVMVVLMVMLMMVEVIGCPYLAQGVVKAFADQLHLILIEGDEAADEVGDQQSASHPNPHDRGVETERLGGRQERNGVDNRGCKQKG